MGNTVNSAGKIRLHDVVRVKPGVAVPVLSIEIGGWQGTVVKINRDEFICTVAWNAATRRHIDARLEQHCWREGIDPAEMALPVEDLELVTPRVGTPGGWGPVLRGLTTDQIRKIADSPTIFQRGSHYYRLGMVKKFAAADGRITATVRGNSGHYTIHACEADGELQADCNCPYDGTVCKHIVAVLLRFVTETQSSLPAGAVSGSGPIRVSGDATIEEIEEKLAELRARRTASTPPPATPSRVPLLEVLRQTDRLSPLFAYASYGTEQQGISLHCGGYVTVQYVDNDYANVDVREADDKRYVVSIANGNGRLNGLSLVCNCHANRMNPGARCPHIAAAVHALREQAIARVTPEQRAAEAAARWETQLTQALGNTKPAKRAAPRTLLFFSLREQYDGAWRLAPYTAPTSLFTPEVLEDRDALCAAISNLASNYQIKEVNSYQQLPANLLYASSELASLARVVAMANVYHLSSPLAFALPQLTDALLFRGDGDYYGRPGAMPITHVDPAPRPLRLNLESGDAGLRILPAVSEGDAILPLSAENTRVVCIDPLWVLLENRLLRLDGDGALLKNLLSVRDLVIPSDAKKTFVTRYLPALLNRVEIADDAFGRCEELDVPPTNRVYLSEENDSIIVDLAYAYGEYELPLETAWPPTATQYDEEREALVTIRRHTDAEEAAWRSMSEFGLKRDGERFVLRAKVTPVDFLLRHLPRMQAEGYAVFGEEALKSARVNRNQPKVRITVSSGIDWFDVLAVVSYGDLEVSLAAIRKAIKARQGYVQLPDGSLGVLPEELIARYRHLFAMGQETETGVRLSKTQTMLLELTLRDTDARVDEEYTRRVEQLRAFTGIAMRALPATFRGELRHYQQAGFDWLHFLHDYGFGGCLADDMGIGKTVQALVFLQSLYTEEHASAASLIVMPRSLLENWAREAARFTPDLKVVIHADGDRADDHTSFDGCHLVLTTYGVMLRDLEMFRRYCFHYIVLDEAQAMKNPASQTARAARMLVADHRLALTGTPVENSTEELWSLFAFLNPGQLGSQDTFREQFATPIQRGQDEAAANALRALIHPFILRRTKEQVAPELPPRTERLIYCEMSASQRKLYQRTRDRYRAELLGLIDSGGMQTARFKVLEGLLRLRQLANDPRLVDKSFKGASSKFEAIIEAMEVLREEGHKALVFSQFTSMLSLLRASLDAREWPYLYLDGKTQRRQELVDRFQTDETIPFFLISLKAGGTGLNLTAADYVIHIDPWWNPAVERQATDRTHRIGQDRPVMVYKFIAEETVEEKILLLQERKQALVDQLITTEGSFMKSLTRDDVAALFA